MRSRTEKALVVICSLLAIAQAVLVTYFGYANFYRDYHAALLIVAMLLGGLLSSAVSCVFHELGHILFGKICGFRFNALHVWFFHIVKSGGKMRIRFGRMPEGEAGSAEMLPMSSEKMRSRYCLVTAGGLVFSFLWFVGALLALIFAHGAPFAVYALIATSLPYAFYLFACNILPFSDPPTDGAILLGLARGDAASLTAVNILSIEGYLMRGDTPSQIPEELYYGAPQLPEDDGNFILLTDYRLARALDEGDARTAAALSDRLKGLAQFVPSYCRLEVAADVLFVECSVKQDVKEAQRLYPALRQYLKGERTVTAQRIAAAYELFAGGDRAACLRHLSAAQELAEACTVPGAVLFERKLLACIREELEQRYGEEAGGSLPQIKFEEKNDPDRNFIDGMRRL